MSDKLEDKADGCVVGFWFLFNLVLCLAAVYFISGRLDNLDTRIKTLEQQAQERKP